LPLSAKGQGNMAVRRPASAEEAERVRDYIDHNLGRIYLLWLLGILVGALRLQPSGLSMGGFSFTVQNASIVEGVIFLGCIAYYVALFSPGVRVTSTLPPYSNTHIRTAIYSILIGTGLRDRSLTKRSSTEIRMIKLAARGARCYRRFARFVYYFLPLGHILIFRHDALWGAIKVVFSRSAAV
jgi:hypothetical protein